MNAIRSDWLMFYEAAFPSARALSTAASHPYDQATGRPATFHAYTRRQSRSSKPSLPHLIQGARGHVLMQRSYMNA